MQNVQIFKKLYGDVPQGAASLSRNQPFFRKEVALRGIVPDLSYYK